ncbi:unnamed protein product [Gongylonema pulchrum]|uniref:Ovule protein n=1 Tax=Gongylonema pulchrum TaxID=637853 RepID=A0A183DJ03_9BILA|nr:unnamed protein product [Gongylonema pulchrum]
MQIALSKDIWISIKSKLILVHFHCCNVFSQWTQSSELPHKMLWMIHISRKIHDQPPMSSVVAIFHIPNVSSSLMKMMIRVLRRRSHNKYSHRSKVSNRLVFIDSHLFQ